MAKGVFYRCFGVYVEQNTDIHDKGKLTHIAPMVDIAFVQTICTILDALLIENDAKVQALKDDDLKRQAYEAFFVFAGLWAIGGGIGGG